ncbi:hypothetical protein V2J09_023707 [Rumex salicifolius]
MGLTNFVLTVAGVGAVILLARTDIKQSATIFKRNARQIRNWLEDESVAASKSAKKGTPKELEKKNHHKEDKD